ncbi:hypothetical protein AB0G60_00160 [Streptomyces angustmyceticus]|uniref:Secreted protein n=1 Tax=Streptomyces angustmyceticus TaxID=285578 RepID=A0A5J4LCQ9_9ACTN|nr:hypothetical protein [Streptomyces angustmyceticus]UAL65133.1 hypothetical protein K7396_00185 [Streptomyces angustmyceticus]GES28428.1 hypothetical protein San01_09150 [Streptomyces angustmyceticus]
MKVRRMVMRRGAAAAAMSIALLGGMTVAAPAHAGTTAAARGAVPAAAGADRIAAGPPCKVYHHGVVRLGVHTYCSNQPSWRRHRARATCVNHSNPRITYTRWGPWRKPGQKSSMSCNFEDGYDYPWVDLR